LQRLPALIQPARISNLRTFSFSQPFSKSGQSSDLRDVADIWSLKTTLVTEERFPAVLRRSEVKSTTTKERNPLELALDDVLAKTAEIGVRLLLDNAN
jgi:hypothetical protein